MATKRIFLRWLSGALVVAAMQLAAAAAVDFAALSPAQAQGRDFFGSPRPRYQRAPNFFDNLFGGTRQQSGPPSEYERAPQQSYESSRAPAPKKSDTPPTMSVLVFGDSMADWLGYGLEDALADAPEIGIVRKSKVNSGLLRYEARSDLDWWHVVRDTLGKEKADFVVMMLGINDRQSIKESQVETAADKKTAKETKDAKDSKDSKDAKDADKKDDQSKDADKKDDQTKTADKKSDDEDDDDTPSIVAPEPKRSAARGVIEFRTERWEEVYGKRIDETIAALKSKGAPVIWVGLPPLRGTRSTADTQYLNDLYRAHAEKAGIVFVDVWDGFVDEGGKFTTHGPDFEGQIRRLRSADGVHFTKYGARKVAHYVERELRRFISNKSMPMALPSETPAGTAPDANSAPAAARPVAGPVVPLTVATGENEELLGGNATRPTHTDPIATRVLVKGEPVTPPTGRADDFAWPRPGDANAAVESLSPTAAAARAQPDQPAKPAPKEAARDGKKGKAAKTKDAEKELKPKSGPKQTPKPGTRAQLRPPQPVQQQRRDNGPFGWLR
jgi:hypothetical protein